MQEGGGRWWRGPLWRLTSLVLTRKFQTVWLRSHFWGRLKLQLSSILNLCLISWALGNWCHFGPVVFFLTGPSTHSFLSQPSALGKDSLFFSCPYGFCIFPECHIIGTIEYLAFIDWLLFLGNIHLKFLHIILWLVALLFCNYWIIMHGCISLFIHSPIKIISSLLPIFGNYEKSYCNHLCASLCWDVSFQVIW